MRGDWSRAFRNDYTEPEKLPEHDAMMVSECSIVPHQKFKTWKNVFLGERLIGMVRVQITGWSECVTESGEHIYCGTVSKLNSKDNIYSLAVLKLRERCESRADDMEL